MYQLRRVGKKATVRGVADVMPLEKERTCFGRHSGNDYYLDSEHLTHFISRWHAEITKKVSHGRTQYLIKDKSLNGTYVSGRRIDGEHILAHGEEVIFGHCNGSKIKPGQLASQKESEFHFVFECNSEVKQNRASSPATGSVDEANLPAEDEDEDEILRDISNTSKKKSGQENSSRTAEHSASNSPSSMSPPEEASVSSSSTRERSTADKSPVSNKRTRNSGAPGAKSRGKASGAKRKKKSDGEGGDKEDETFHYDGEMCAAPDCPGPVEDNVNWVQCDDCDEWFHTTCIGCKMDPDHLEEVDFHCGCKR